MDFIFDLDMDFDLEETQEEIVEVQDVTTGLKNITECKEFFYSVAPKYFRLNSAFVNTLDAYQAVANMDKYFTDMIAFSDFLLDEIFASYDKQYTYNTSCKRTAKTKEFNMDTYRLSLNELRNKILNVG
jgi:hypothetical protein